MCYPASAIHFWDAPIGLGAAQGCTVPAAGLQKAEKGLGSEDLEPGRVYKPLFSAFGSELAFLDPLVAFPFQASLPRQLENVRACTSDRNERFQRVNKRGWRGFVES